MECDFLLGSQHIFILQLLGGGHTKRYRKLLLLFIAFVFTAFVLMIALVVYVDPFFHYHKPLKNFNYVVDNQLTQNPGMAEHLEYDSVILGSSMTVNFETDWFEELMGLKTAKLSYSGAFPKDQSNIMKLIFDSRWNGEKREVKRVFLGVDVITYTGDVEQTKYPIPRQARAPPRSSRSAARGVFYPRPPRNLCCARRSRRGRSVRRRGGKSRSCARYVRRRGNG